MYKSRYFLYAFIPLLLLLLINLSSACFKQAVTNTDKDGDNADYQYNYGDNDGGDNGQAKGTAPPKTQNDNQEAAQGDPQPKSSKEVSKKASSEVNDGLPEDEVIGYCASKKLKKLIDEATDENYENLQAAAVYIQEKAAEQFGGKFQAIVSECEFGYRNWYDGEICYTESNDRYVLAWRD